jgi:hypothetical protein
MNDVSSKRFFSGDFEVLHGPFLTHENQASDCFFFLFAVNFFKLPLVLPLASLILLSSLVSLLLLRLLAEEAEVIVIREPEVVVKVLREL